MTDELGPACMVARNAMQHYQASISAVRAAQPVAQVGTVMVHYQLRFHISIKLSIKGGRLLGRSPLGSLNEKDSICVQSKNYGMANNVNPGSNMSAG